MPFKRRDLTIMRNDDTVINGFALPPNGVGQSFDTPTTSITFTARDRPDGTAYITKACTVEFDDATEIDWSLTLAPGDTSAIVAGNNRLVWDVEIVDASGLTYTPEGGILHVELDIT